MGRETIDILKVIRRVMQGATLAAIAALGVLSIVGAFLGAAGARAMFNSIPMEVFWVVLTAMLAAGFFVFRPLRSRLWTPRGLGLAAVHAGCVLVLAGGMVGSDAGQRLAERLGRPHKVRSGFMIIREGTATPFVGDERGNLVGHLPFAVGLEDFQIEHYGPPRPWMLGVSAPAPIDGRPPRRREIHWTLGREVSVPFTDARVKVLMYMPSARPVDPDGAAPDDTTGAAAMEVLVTRGEKSMRTWLIAPARDRGAGVALAPLAGDADPLADVRLVMMPPPPRPIRDYKSRLAILDRDRKVLRRKTIEVNHPLHYAGYHFYQFDYDHRRGEYTVLRVESDSGLIPVYAGFALLCGGTFVLMWLRRGEPGPVTNGHAAYRLVVLAFPLLTLGLILGAVWGKIAWGDWWNWDPKELWSLASWLIFAAYLHMRTMPGGRDAKLPGVLILAGMAAIVLTLLWVNFGADFRGGLHRYSSAGAVLAVKHTPVGLLVLAGMALYGVAAALLTVARLRAAGRAVFAAGFAAALAAFVVRWIEVEHLPMQNMFEIFLCLGVLALPMSAFCRAFLKTDGEAGDAFLGFLVLLPAALIFGADPQHLPPALQHWLFAPHVAAYLIAYMILAKAARQAGVGLVKGAWGAPV